MSTQKPAHPAAAKIVLPSSVRILLGIGLVVLAVVAVITLLPPGGGHIFSTGLMACALVLYAGMMTRSWLLKRRSGAVLRNLGHTEPTSSVAIILALCVGLLKLYVYSTEDQHDGYQLAQGILWLTFAALIFVESKQPTLITVRGWYKTDATVTWGNIASFKWDVERDGSTVLVLQFRHKQWWSNSARFRIPTTEKLVVEELLLQHGAAQHGVHPTADPAGVERYG